MLERFLGPFSIRQFVLAYVHTFGLLATCYMLSTNSTTTTHWPVYPLKYLINKMFFILYHHFAV